MSASFQVYRNLNKRPAVCWSVRTKGKVIGHAQRVSCFGVRLHNGESTRLRAVAKGQRAVCAWAVADGIEWTDWKPEGNRAPLDELAGQHDGWLRYDWQSAKGFTDRDTGERLPERLRGLYFEDDGQVRYWL